MTHFTLVDRFLRLAGRAPLLAVALLVACSSSDKRPLVLVDVPLGGYPTAQTVVVDVVVPGVAPSELRVDLTAGSVGAAAAGHYGVYLTSGTSGSATVSVSLRNASGCELASGGGAGPVSVSPGETSGPVAIILTQSTLACGPDAGLGPDTLPPPADVVSPTEAAFPDLATGVDGGSLPPPDANLGDGVAPDGLAPDVAPDVPVLLDLAGDASVPDIALPAEVGGDVIPDLVSGIDLPVADAEVGPTTMNVFRNCGSYTHSEIVNGTPSDYAVTQLFATPDGKNLVSFGDDGRAKVWNVTATGLAEPSSELVFTGSGALYGGISTDGTYLAVGDHNATVKIFDLPRSIADGAAVLQWTLPNPTDPANPDAGYLTVDAVDFAVVTNDHKSAVVGYYGGYGYDNYLAIWELGSSAKIVQLVTLTYPLRAWTGVPGASPAHALVATERGDDTDAGHQTTLAVLDVSSTSVARVEATVPGPGYFKDMIFSADGNSLAVGFDTGLALLYDLTDKTKMVQQSPPLIPEASASGYTYVYGMSFTLDGRYLAAGYYDDNAGNASVKLLPVATRQSTEKTLKYQALSAAFLPSGLGLAVGEAGDGVLLYCTP